jgi:hypothetical protein
VHVQPLAYADAAAESPALTLLIDRLVDADYRRYSELRAQDRVLAARICQRLDGLPLALELAAARARDLPLAHIVAGLDERFTLLGAGQRTADRRHHTLRAMIDWSYALLTSAERELFARLSLFAGSFTLQAAVAVCTPEDPAGGRAALQSLVAKSLVTMVEDRAGEARYRLLESLRAYALDRLRESGTYDAGMRRFATYFAELAMSCDARSGHMPNGALFALVEPEIANFRAALEWSLAEGHDPALRQHLRHDAERSPKQSRCAQPRGRAKRHRRNANPRYVRAADHRSLKRDRPAVRGQPPLLVFVSAASGVKNQVRDRHSDRFLVNLEANELEAVANAVEHTVALYVRLLSRVALLRGLAARATYTSRLGLNERSNVFRAFCSGRRGMGRPGEMKTCSTGVFG